MICSGVSLSGHRGDPPFSHHRGQRALITGGPISGVTPIADSAGAARHWQPCSRKLPAMYRHFGRASRWPNFGVVDGLPRPAGGRQSADPMTSRSKAAEHVMFAAEP